MRIAKSQQQRRTVSRAERWLWAAALLMIFGLGWLAGNGGWHERLGAWATAFWRDPGGVFAAWSARANIPTLYLDLKFVNIQQLSARRLTALESGAYLGGDAPVPGKLTLNGASAEADVSLPEVEAAALLNDRFPFAVTLRDESTLLDMRQATLWPIDEQTSWPRMLFSRAYRAALRERGIPATACEVVRLNVNGMNWGLYVMEETPATATAALEGFSPESVVVYFDRRVYLEVQPVVDESSFAYAKIAVVPVRETPTRVGATRPDPALAALRADVERILRGVEQGTYPPSAAFDPQTLADFMALTMLWRGDFALDWRALHLIYDPATRRFTPLATGALPGHALPLPAAFTADPAIQQAHAQALAAFGQPEFLASVQRSADWRADEAVAAGDAFAAADVLDGHQTQMRILASPARTLVAVITESEGAWQLRLTNAIPFSLEVLSLDIGERAVLPLDPAWVVETDRARLLDAANGIVLPAFTVWPPSSVTVRVPVAALREIAPGPAEAVSVVTRIWGLDARIPVPADWRGE